MRSVILFDLGNTLLRYYSRAEFPEILTQAITNVQNYLRAEGLLNVSLESIWPRVEEENHEAEDHSVRPLEGRLTRIFQLDSPTDETIITACRHFMEPIFAVAHRYEDVLPALQKLGKMGIRRVIVSNAPWGCPGSLWRGEIKRFGLDEHIDAAFFCTDIGWRKPARQIFDYVLEKLQVEPQDCLFVGDDPRWDIVGPRAVGIEAVLIDRQGIMKDSAEEPIKSLYELLTLFGTEGKYGKNAMC